MKKILRITVAVVLSLILVCGCFSASAKVINGKEQYDYGSYVLLGDSVASGWSDLEEIDTSFTRVDNSYGAFLADDLGATYHPMACIGFRTVEMRYVFEDDYEGDRFLFKSIDDSIMEEKIPLMRQEVANADIITLNVGGNDWGTYVGWHVEEAVANMSGTTNFVEEALPYLENTVNFGIDTIETLVGMADLAQCLPELVQVLPAALEEGFSRFVANWNIMIEDIYALNPDVTLVVIGMFDNSLQDESMADAENTGISLPTPDIGINIGQTIVDLANTPMRDGADKYGYIFIDPVGTLCEKQHPSKAGHRYIADLILEALPDASFPYTDIEKGTKEFNTVQKLYTRGLMAGVSATEFAPEAALTKLQLADALYNIAGAPAVEGALADTASAAAVWANEKGILTADAEGNFSPDKEITSLAFAKAMFADAKADGFAGFIKGLMTFFKVVYGEFFGLNKAISRIDAASYLVSYCGF